MSASLSHLSNERQPLINQDLLSQYIEKRLINGTKPIESLIHLIFRRSLQTLAVTGGVSARFLFIRISLDYAGDNKVFGGFLAAGSAISYGAIISWCLLEMIKNTLSPQLNEERLINQLQMPKFAKPLIKTSVFAIGILSQMPMAYMSYDYNNKNLFFPIAVILIDSSFPIYSLNLTAENLIRKKRYTLFEKQLASLKELTINALNEISSETNLDVWYERIEAMQAIKSQEVDKVKNFMSQLFSKYNWQASLVQNEPCLLNGGRWISRGIGGVLSISQLSLLAVLGYNAMQLITDNEVFWYIGGGTAFLCNLFLDMQLTIGGTVQGYDSIINLLTGTSKKTLPATQYPYLRKIMQVFTLTICALSFGGPVKVSQDFFSGGLSLYMQIATATGTIILSSSACLNLVDKIIGYGMLKKGSEEVRQLMNIAVEIRRIASLVDKSPMIEFARFTKMLPDDVIEGWLNRVEITSTNIDEYIGELEN